MQLSFVRICCIFLLLKQTVFKIITLHLHVFALQWARSKDSDIPFWSIFILILNLLLSSVSFFNIWCLRLFRFQHIRNPFVRVLLTQHFSPGSFSGRWRLSSHLKDNLIEVFICCFTRQWKSYKSNGLLSECQTLQKCLCPAPPPPWSMTTQVAFKQCTQIII